MNIIGQNGNEGLHYEKEKPKTEGSGANNEGVAGSDENTGSPQEQEEVYSEVKTQKEVTNTAWGIPGGGKKVKKKK